MTGYTKVQSASKQIAPGAHTLTFLVMDKYDGRMDSAVFIEGGSVTMTRRSAPAESSSVLQVRAHGGVAWRGISASLTSCPLRGYGASLDSK